MTATEFSPIKDGTLDYASPDRYHYCRGSDGIDDTWDIYGPHSEFVISIRFWGDPDDPSDEQEAEGRARRIVDTLNAGYWW